MKIKYSALIVFFMAYALVGKCQHQLYFENFEGASNTFTINDSVLGINSGNNKWIVDTNYFAGGIYSKTYNEDSTYSGSISYAPYGHYLHIYDSASTYLNDNYNPKDSSTRFADMTSGICTKSLTNINFNFFYLCQGSPSAYAEVYYNIDGAGWTSTGAILQNKYKWQYATITNPAFTDVEDLKFGFLWHNDTASGRDTSALGIDDVSMYGTYDSLAHPISCTFNTLIEDSCLGQNPYVFFSATLTDSTCDAEWNVEMSNGNGNFSPGGTSWYGYVGPTYFNDITNYWYLTMPANFVTVGHCYKFKLSRATYPFLTFIDSICYPFDSCPGTITTLQPPATIDTNPVCAGSIMDVPFFSTGIYDVYNTYVAQLIDSTGSNTAIIDTIGYIVNNLSYPPTVFPPIPGDIVGTVPLTAPAGCKYYVRVVCNTGNRPSTMWGPFCIQHCDIKTNEQQSVQVCLGSCTKQPQGFSDSITYSDSLSSYFNGNKFEVQLIQFMLYPASFATINTGLFGVTVDNSNGHYKLRMHIPCPDTLFANGISPGVYYARIIADSSSYPDSSLGSLIQLTIGQPADSLALSLLTPGPFCSGQPIEVITNPDDQYAPYNSTYQWWITDKVNGTLPFNNWTQGYINFYTAVGDTVVISCQENNNNCLGGKAFLKDTIVILGPPSSAKAGPPTVCLGDTGVFSIPFSNNTDYIWTLPVNTHADTSNNVLKIKFDTTGTFTLSVIAINACYSSTATWTVTVGIPPTPIITAKPAVLCNGVVDTLTVSGGTHYKWYNGRQTPSITVSPVINTSYWVAVTVTGCTLYDTLKLTVNQKPDVSVTSCVGEEVFMHASGASTYTWSPNTVEMVNDSVVKAVLYSIQTFTVTGTTAAGCKDTASVVVDPSVITDNISTAVGIEPDQNIQLTTTGGNSWVWSPSVSLNCDTCPDVMATPLVTTVYTVEITNSNGCVVYDTVTVEVGANCDIFVPNAFSPGNLNNKNTILYVRSECLTSVDFTVFDRWGNKVFESESLSDGWDGNYRGQPMNQGTFVYYVTGKTSDGKTLTKKGNVTLIR